MAHQTFLRGRVLIVLREACEKSSFCLALLSGLFAMPSTPGTAGVPPFVWRLEVG